MNEKKEKSTSRFLHSIDKYAKRQRLKIAEEIKQIEEKRLRIEEQKIVETARTLMMSELANVKSEVFMKVSNVRNICVQKIHQKKSDIQKEIFEMCESKVLEFTKTDLYVSRLEKSFDSALKLFGKPMSVFYREQDSKVLSFISDKDIEIHSSKKIKYGGLIFCKNGVVLDDTFDVNIAIEKQLFLEKYFSHLV